MGEFDISEEIPGREELLALYEAVGWTAYTVDADRLVESVSGSHLILTARGPDHTLVGMVRTLSDGATITYIQDILVSPTHQRSGIGGALLDEVLRRSDVRQVVLLTDSDPGQRAFYESRGFVESHEVEPSPLRSFVRLR